MQIFEEHLLRKHLFFKNIIPHKKSWTKKESQEESQRVEDRVTELKQS